MDFDSLASSYISQAEERLSLAKIEYERKKYNIVVRLCQESVELFLKACLRLINIEPPKFHDVGPILKNNADKFPQWFKEKNRHFCVVLKISKKRKRIVNVR